MLSTSKLAPFSLTQLKPNEKLFKKQRFTAHMVSPLQQYKQQMSGNVAELKNKYPLVEVDYIKSLLEQLENNTHMVADILDEQHKKHLKNCMEEERSESQLSLCEVRKEKLDLPKTQDVKVLQKSVVKLFKKFAEEKREKEQLLKKLAVLSRENQNLKLMNKQLMSQQMQQSSLVSNADIY